MIVHFRAAAIVTIVALSLMGCAKQDSNSTTASTTASATPSVSVDAGAAASPLPTVTPSTAVTASPPASPPLATPANLQTVSYTDIHGLFGEKEITQLASLGVFGTPTGQFNASKPILRREFIRWLFLANNAIWANDPNKLFHPAQGSDSSFKDVQTSDPDFPYIEGLQDSGVSVGFPDKTFRAEQPITREQALAIKSALDRGGVENAYVVTKTDTVSGYYNLPPWKDKQQISPEYVGAIATGYKNDSGAANETAHFVYNVDRTFGAIAALKPKQVLTRGEAALMIWKIGPHASSTSLLNARSAADALASGGASPTP